jgi:hypothetical protein
MVAIINGELMSARERVFVEITNRTRNRVKRDRNDDFSWCRPGGRMCIVTELCELEGYEQKVAGWVGGDELDGGCAGVVVYDFPIPTAGDYCKRRGGENP